MENCAVCLSSVGTKFPGCSSTAEHRLKADAAHICPAQAKIDGFPKVRQVIRCDGHGQGYRQLPVPAAFQAPLPGGAQVCAPQKLLPGFLRSVKLQIQLKPSVFEGGRQFTGECPVVRNADAIGIEQDVIDLWV